MGRTLSTFARISTVAGRLRPLPRRVRRPRPGPLTAPAPLHALVRGWGSPSRGGWDFRTALNCGNAASWVGLMGWGERGCG